MSVQSSSLIFVIVVAIWAVYLLQYWVKRRDHLSTVRSVDRFSAAMRVLDHHRLHDEGAEVTPRSYSVTPTKAARPTVTVKHAASPSAARGGASPAPVARPASPVGRVVGASRRTRGLTLLTHLVLLPVVTLLAVLGPLPWWAPVVMVVGTVGAFGWLRQGVAEERVAARSRARAAARAERRPATLVSRDRRSQPRAAHRTEPVTVPVAGEPTAGPVVQKAADVPFDVSPEQPVAEPVAEVVHTREEREAAEPLPGTWEPTPVPRPTYTMKARAERPEQAPAPAPAPAPLPETMAPIEDDLEELPAVDADLVDPRRVVGG